MKRFEFGVKKRDELEAELLKANGSMKKAEARAETAHASKSKVEAKYEEERAKVDALSES